MYEYVTVGDALKRKNVGCGKSFCKVVLSI